MHNGIFGPIQFSAAENDSAMAMGRPTPVPMTCGMSTPVSRPERLMLYLDAAISGSYPGTGTTWSDLSGQGNHASLVNGPVFASENGGVLVFDGANDHARINNSASLNMGAGSWTGELWVRIPTFATGERILFEYGPFPNSGMYQFTTNGAEFGPLSSGLIANTLAANAAGKALRTGYSPLTTNTWLHVAAQLDVEKDRFRIFVNGLPIAQNSGVTQDNASATRSMFLFCRNGTSIFMPCRCGAVLVYNIALSQEELRHNYHRLRVRYQ